MQRRRTVLTCMLVIVLILLSSCSKQEKAYSSEIYAMNTVMNFELYGENAKEASEKIEKYIYELENKISMHSKTSELYKLNHASVYPVVVSAELKDIIEKSLEASEKTNGTFDITAAPITELWGIGTEGAKVPSHDEIMTELLKVGYRDIKVSGNEVTFLKGGMKIDLGGIGKGYATDGIVKILDDYGIGKAIISLGGNVYVKGEKKAGKDFTVGVRDPENGNDYIGTVALKNKSIVTSGAYERFFEKDGKIYHHIFDLNTGYPADSDLKSVTIISDSSTEADAYSTALFVMGLDEAMTFCEENPQISAILVTNRNRVYVSDNLKEKFTLKKGGIYKLL